MKALLVLFIALGIVRLVHADNGNGHLHFGNDNSSVLITTNDGVNSGPIAGIRAYGFSLHIGPAGTPESGLERICCIATNISTSPGMFRFNAGSGYSAIINAPYPLYDAGTVIAFQVRGWALSSGSTTYESAQSVGAPVGKSRLGFITLGGANGLFPTPALFGTDPGQIGGFVIGIPEPSIYLLLSAFCCTLLLRYYFFPESRL